MLDDSGSIEKPLVEPNPRLTVDQAYTLWSKTYDGGANPVLSLEERYLWPMLPALEGKTVLDLGCGTGRLLNRLSSSEAVRYIGVDLSAAMLALATEKLRVPGHLLRADCLDLPLREHTADVLICSFLLGYVSPILLASEVARVSKVASDLFVSEFHPDSLVLGWKRSFRSGDQVIELPATSCSLQEVEHAFELHGFDLIRKVEPGFDEPERKIFLANKKSHAYESIYGIRAIFIYHFRKRSHAA